MASDSQSSDLSNRNSACPLFGQTNKLFSQLTAAEWDDLKDFSVDEKQKKIYLLNHDKIYSAKY